MPATRYVLGASDSDRRSSYGSLTRSVSPKGGGPQRLVQIGDDRVGLEHEVGRAPAISGAARTEQNMPPLMGRVPANHFLTQNASPAVTGSLSPVVGGSSKGS